MNEKETVFYSWQSTSPNKINRNFIQNTIEKSIRGLNRETALEVALDRDTKGESGSPNIRDTIFSKIEEASAIICDVTIVAQSPNPNVLVELGYAISTLGWDRIIMIMNTNSHRIEELPFDIRHHRVQTYNLSDSSTEQTRKEEKKKLTESLTKGLKSIFEKNKKIKNTTQVDAALFKEFQKCLPSTGSIRFIHESNMAGLQWKKKELNDLYDFLNKWKFAEYQFIDKEIENEKNQLYSLIDKYLYLIETETFSSSIPNHRAIPTEWEYEQPERFHSTVKNLHEAAEKVFTSHQTLIKLAKGRLG